MPAAPPSSAPRHVVIVGGGFAGLDAARAESSRGARHPDRSPESSRVSAAVYQVATAGLSPGDIASPIRWILRKQQNVRVLLSEVTRIDCGRRAIILENGDEITYDYLIVAAGATHSYFGHPDWAPHAPGLKSLDDAW